MRSLSLAVVGADYPNKNGGNRRTEIAFCNPGEPVHLRPEPKNEFDEHAIAVFSARDFQIGYLKSERAVYVGGLLRLGHEVTGIFQDLAPWGAIIRIGVDEAPALPTLTERQLPEHDETDPEPDFYPDFVPADE